jgi:predicted glycoside hydrolase/deacetylase ChbG (UPF0249 family)
VAGTRYLVVTADDFGIGPATTEGILDLAAAGRVTGSVLLVNSPYAEDAIKQWRLHGRALELGWHPCLTLDQPITPHSLIPSLVGPDGYFWSLGAFISRFITGRIKLSEIEIELRAQIALCQDLLGHAPTVVNFHHHLQVFPAIGAALRQILSAQGPLPYLRRVLEPWAMIQRISGARLKRVFLSALGKTEYARQVQAGFPGNDWLAGVTDPPFVEDTDFLVRWIRSVPGRIVELTCHPGHRDRTLIGRDCTATDGHVQRRVSELRLLASPSFAIACETAGFRCVSPSEVIKLLNPSLAHAA